MHTLKYTLSLPQLPLSLSPTLSLPLSHMIVVYCTGVCGITEIGVGGESLKHDVKINRFIWPKRLFICLRTFEAL